MNKLHKYSKELLKLNEIKDFIEKNSLEDIREEYTIEIFKSIFNFHRAFANALYKEVELQFITLYITTLIGLWIFHIKLKEYTHYINLMG